MAGELAPYRDGIPTVADATTRDALFPLATRAQGQRVYRLDTGTTERWGGSAWVDVLQPALPGQGRTVATLSAYLANNRVFDLLDYAVAGTTINTGVTLIDTAVTNALAAIQANGGGILRVPAGRYKGSLQYLNVDNLTVEGDGESTVFVPAGANILFAQSDGSGTYAAHYNLRLRNFTIDLTGNVGPASAGIIQLNNAQNFRIEGVTISGRGDSYTDGFAWANGSFGTLANCVVDGIGKCGYYQSTGAGYSQLVNCVAKNQANSVAGGGFGVGIGGADLVNCSATYCANGGVLFYPVGNAGSEVAQANVRVIGGEYSHNGKSGIDFDSTSTTVVANHIHLIGVRCELNTAHGIRVLRGQHIKIVAPICRRNGGYGIQLGLYAKQVSVSEPTLIENRTDTVTYTTGAAIWLEACTYVTVRGGTYLDEQGSPTQTYGVVTANNGATQPNHVYLLDIENNVNGSTAGGIANGGGTVTAGLFRWTDDTASPETARIAPPGSSYRIGGVWYDKATGTGATGWRVRSPRSLGTQAIGIGSTTIAHGLGYAPTLVQAIPYADARVWRAASADATNIYLIANVAVSADVSVG